jgi:hypothetical protein
LKDPVVQPLTDAFSGYFRPSHRLPNTNELVDGTLIGDKMSSRDTVVDGTKIAAEQRWGTIIVTGLSCFLCVSDDTPRAGVLLNPRRSALCDPGRGTELFANGANTLLFGVFGAEQLGDSLIMGVLFEPRL